MPTPHPEELEQARLKPGGWVYRIAGVFKSSDAVPPEAIVGAWQVGPTGEIVGEFIPNDRYDPKRFPAG